MLPSDAVPIPELEPLELLPSLMAVPPHTVASSPDSLRGSRPNPELMRSLGRLVRGLSALFWGLPLALVVCVWTANPQWMKSFGVVPPLVCTGLLAYGLLNLGAFQKQERVWRNALDRAQLFALINLGLSPFLYWWSRLPSNTFFSVIVLLLGLSALLFLGSLNLVLQRLGAMLPDEGLRLEIKQFTALNLNLLFLTFVCCVAYFVLARIELTQVQKLHFWLAALLGALDRHGLWWALAPMVLVLLPLAMTMALLWKTKEVILENVFSAK